MSYHHLPHTTRDRERGQGLVEYALILVLVAVVVIVILAALGPRIGNIFSTVVDALTKPQKQPCSITLDASHGSAVLTVPTVILDHSSLSSGDWYWDGGGDDQLKNSSVGSTTQIARFASKSWRSLVVKAEGKCSPFPNI